MQTTQNPGAARGVFPRLSAMMFLEFFVWGAWYVTVGNYMGAHGMGDLIGLAYTVAPIAAILSPLFLGLVADRFFPTQAVLALLHLVGGVCLIAAPFAAEPFQNSTGGALTIFNAPHLVVTNPFLLLLLLHTLCYMPTLGLTNTLAFHNLPNREKQFPLVRVFGTIGWIIAGLLIAALTRRFLPGSVDQGDDAAVAAAVAQSPLFFYLAGGAGLLLGLFSFALPHTPPPMRGEKFSAGQALGLDALGLLRGRSFAVFALCSFLICIPLAGYYAFAPVFLNAVGVAEDRVPFYMSFGQMSEILFMLVMPLCFARLGVKWMILIGMGAWLLRYGLFAGAAPTEFLPLVIGGIILHGICYDFFFVTGQIYVDQASPAKIRGQAQGFLVLITQGLGMLIGASVFQWLRTVNTTDGVTDWQTVWLIPAAFAGVIMVVFFLFFRNPPKKDSDAPADASGDKVDVAPVEPAAEAVTG